MEPVLTRPLTAAGRWCRRGAVAVRVVAVLALLAFTAGAGPRGLHGALDDVTGAVAAPAGHAAAQGHPAECDDTHAAHHGTGSCLAHAACAFCAPLPAGSASLRTARDERPPIPAFGTHAGRSSVPGRHPPKSV